MNEYYLVDNTTTQNRYAKINNNSVRFNVEPARTWSQEMILTENERKRYKGNNSSPIEIPSIALNSQLNIVVPVFLGMWESDEEFFNWLKTIRKLDL
jgi:hypothetical protein